MADKITERRDAITFKGKPMTLMGNELKIGEIAPDFLLMTGDLNEVDWASVSENGKKAVLMILVPSLDTSVCSLETNKFNRHVGSLPPDKISAVAISSDTPFAQRRWANQEKIDKIRMLSDHKDRSFADAYGVRIKELGLLARAIYLIDGSRKVLYVQLLSEVAQEPDYDAVMKAAHRLVDAA